MANIKKQFPEFFQSSLKENDLESNSNNLIVLDTNFLLDIIQMPTKIAKKYIETLESVKDNIYIPYLVALEFNFRKSGIKKEKHANIGKYRDSVKKSIENLTNTVEGHGLITIKESKEEFSSDLIKKVENFEKSILNMLDEKVSVSITKEEDEIYKELISLIEDKIGVKYKQEWIDSIELDGEERYEDKIPPGFDDAGKDDTDEEFRRYDNLIYRRKFGDLIIWKDIIKYSKDLENKDAKVIFITDDGRSDKKNDLLYKVDKLIVGPHIHLMNELQLEAGKELYILANLRFVQLVSGLTDAEIKSLSTSRHTEESLNEIIEKQEIERLRRERRERLIMDRYRVESGKTQNLSPYEDSNFLQPRDNNEELDERIISVEPDNYDILELEKEYERLRKREIDLRRRREFEEMRARDIELRRRKNIEKMRRKEIELKRRRNKNMNKYSKNEDYEENRYVDRNYDDN